jgi:hypothetical protein
MAHYLRTRRSKPHRVMVPQVPAPRGKARKILRGGNRRANWRPLDRGQ